MNKRSYHGATSRPQTLNARYSLIVIFSQSGIFTNGAVSWPGAIWDQSQQVGLLTYKHLPR